MTALDDKLAKLGLIQPLDFALHLPLRYEDETRLTPIADCIAGEYAQVEAQVLSCEVLLQPRRTLVVQVQDDSGAMTLRFLNFYGSQIALFERAKREALPLRIRGEVRQAFRSYQQLEMVHPKVRVTSGNEALPSALTPVYPAGEGLTQITLRKRIEAALEKVSLDEVLPTSLLARHKFMPLAQAVHTLHHPPIHEAAALLAKTHPAWVRIKFEELLAQQLSLKRAQQIRRAKTAPPLNAGTLTAQLHAVLPFALTAAQQRVVEEIHADLQRSFPMTRLLQGDVGAGKTIVAALAASVAIDSGYQAVLMAPTEILAEQHFQKISALLEPLGVRVAWLIGSLKTAAKRQAQHDISSGAAQLIIGTHALFQEAASFARLGLMVVDEQHRFGVAQRLALRNKTQGYEPHQLMMSATPIPRTLAMTYFADLDVSVIDQLPPGRTPVLTKLIAEERRVEVIARIEQAVRAGRQAYWVCPLIEESEALQLQTAVATHAALSQELPGLNIGLVHGRLAATEKQALMRDFAAQKIQVLVATTVIEVGVDVPNASLMVIEHAERFGLSQLHQLRGRVGRGSAESACILLYAPPLSSTAKARLRVLHETTDGFEIARRDLELRGPGEFLGARQSGVPLLRFADLQTDALIVEQARDAAHWLLQHAPNAAEAHLQRWLGARESYLKT